MKNRFNLVEKVLFEDVKNADVAAFVDIALRHVDKNEGELTWCVACLSEDTDLFRYRNFKDGKEADWHLCRLCWASCYFDDVKDLDWQSREQ